MASCQAHPGSRVTEEPTTHQPPTDLPSSPTSPASTTAAQPSSSGSLPSSKLQTPRFIPPMLYVQEPQLGRVQWQPRGERFMVVDANFGLDEITVEQKVKIKEGDLLIFDELVIRSRRHFTVQEVRPHPPHQRLFIPGLHSFVQPWQPPFHGEVAVLPAQAWAQFVEYLAESLALEAVQKPLKNLDQFQAQLEYQAQHELALAQQCFPYEMGDAQKVHVELELDHRVWRGARLQVILQVNGPLSPLLIRHRMELPCGDPGVRMRQSPFVDHRPFWKLPKP